MSRYFQLTRVNSVKLYSNVLVIVVDMGTFPILPSENLSIHTCLLKTFLYLALLSTSFPGKIIPEWGDFLYPLESLSLDGVNIHISSWQAYLSIGQLFTPHWKNLSENGVTIHTSNLKSYIWMGWLWKSPWKAFFDMVWLSKPPPESFSSCKGTIHTSPWKVHFIPSLKIFSLKEVAALKQPLVWPRECDYVPFKSSGL